MRSSHVKDLLPPLSRGSYVKVDGEDWYRLHYNSIVMKLHYNETPL